MAAVMPALGGGVAGFVVGAVIGYLVLRARLCSFGAIEDALLGHDWRRMKIFGLAFAIALAGAQTLIALGLFDATRSTYIPSQVALASAIVGSLLFGLGMALVGTCAFGSLVRLGAGDLRSLVTMLVFGVVAYATLRGALAFLRLDVFESWRIAMPADTPSSFIDLAASFIDRAAAGAELRLVIAGALALTMAAIALGDARVRQSPRLLSAGVALGLGVVAGWIVTGVLPDPLSDHPTRVQSLTFVSPVARGLFAFGGRAGVWLEFGVMSVPGVVFGAFLRARLSHDFRWEAYDDPREMRRHLLGGALMGFGGVLAGGCTIGQGLTAGSLLSLTWPITVLGMIAGARLGIAILMEGSLTALCRSRLFGAAPSE